MTVIPFGEWRPDVSDYRCNLRLATIGQNKMNSKARSASGFKGVYWNKGRWMAQLEAKGKVYSLGRHDTPEEASRAYMAKARELYGEFARPV